MQKQQKGQTDQLRLLVVGTLPPPVCGTTVSLQHLVESLEKMPGVSFEVINTGGIRGAGWGGLLRLMRLAIQMLGTARRVDVISLHLNPTAVHIVCPIALCCRLLFGPRVVLRLFGGECYRECQGIRGRLLRWCVHRCDLYLAQTKALVKSAQEDNLLHVRWLPTSRPIRQLPDPVKAPGGCHKFVAVGWVSKSKGVPESIRAVERFGPQISADFYGPFAEGMSVADFEGLERSHYRGVIPAGKAVEVMREYHALLFPTYWPGEGYPGVVLEAFQAGLPVITTTWRSIPEIVDDSCGILIPPQDVDALECAIERLSSDAQLYQRLHEGASRKASEFSAQRWNAEFVKYCRELL